MGFIRTSIPEVIIFEPKVLGDARGYFSETFREDLFHDFLGYKIDFCQDNESMSNYGVLRGLHYQLPPFAQSKLVRVLHGCVLDVAVDIRKDSPTFGQHVAIELSFENKRQLLIPHGFAHGFVVLSESAVFSYKVDKYYNPESDRGILFNDPAISIDWQLEKELLQLSEKDEKQPLLKYADLFEFNQPLYNLNNETSTRH